MKLKAFFEIKDAEPLIIDVLNRIHVEGPIYLEDFERLAYLKKIHPSVFSKFEPKLIYLIGLFYKTKEPQNIFEEVYSIFADSIQEETGRKFTPVQANAYRKIQDKRYFSFSAPTSSGKSFLFRELIQRTTGDIIIVVPSRALIAEYMHSVVMLVPKSVLVLQFIENVNRNKTDRRIYVITPERGDELFKMIPELNIRLILFDEAQISEEKIRGMKFDSFVRRVDKAIPDAKKVFTHPFVLNPEAQLKKHNFDSNSDFKRYDQNSVGKIYLTEQNREYYYFSPFESGRTRDEIKLQNDVVEDILKRKGTLLIYTSKSKIYDGSYITDFAKYIDLCPKLSDPISREIINELRDFIGASVKDDDKHSAMIDMMEKGIVVHHGSIPLKARLLIESFVNSNHARICFATSTLTQGINMPFDAVWINNFTFRGTENQKNLDLKNLIGRAGRSTKNLNSFDYGYVIVEHENLKTFCSRLQKTTSLSEKSSLDDDLSELPDDLKDIAEAIKENSFNNELQLTESQVERLRTANIDEEILLILDNLLIESIPLSGNQYYKIPKEIRDKIKTSFQKVYVSHLRKSTLNKGEASVLSAAIPILLWQIQGKSFKQIISLRHAYISKIELQREIRAKIKKNVLTATQASEELSKIKIRFSAQAAPLPNSNLRAVSLFPIGTPADKLEYDILVYDTYDYIDKVISQSITNSLTAALQLYYEKTNDYRAFALKNYIKYGTNNDKEIWLIRYGFAFEDIEWIKDYVRSIDQNQIDFFPSIDQLNSKQRKIIERYL